MVSTSPQPTEEWLYASRDWDIERLIVDIGVAKKQLKPKSKGLSPTEVTFLCLLLCEQGPDAIAQKLHRNLNGVKVDLSKGLYSYIEALIGKRPGDWREIIIWLEQKGYKISQLREPALSTEPLILHQSYNWEEAVDVSMFYGRKEELSTLKQWVLHGGCRLVMLLGMQGIGKKKKSLSVKWAQPVQEHFEYVIWRSLCNAPPLTEILTDLIQSLSDEQKTNLPQDLDCQILLLTQHLRQNRCLMILIRDKLS
ncbi:MAG TPA: NB-ARC domain-containing protein [Cyanophyceae cyanobacterium]